MEGYSVIVCMGWSERGFLGGQMRLFDKEMQQKRILCQQKPEPDSETEPLNSSSAFTLMLLPAISLI